MAKNYKLNAEPGHFGLKGTPLAHGARVSEQTKAVKIHRDNDYIVIDQDGKCLKFPYQVAHRVANAVQTVAQAIEQEKRVIQNIITKS